MRFSELRAAMTREGPSSSARAVWWAIAAHANGDGDAWPSTDLIACMAGMSVRAVTRNLRELEAAGMLETSRLANHRNRYHVVTSAEPQFRFPTGHQRPVNRTPASGRTGQDQLSDQPKRPLEVHKEGCIEGASTSPAVTNGSAATPRRGGGAECTSCRRPIRFAVLPTGHTVALDPEPDPTGDYALLPGNRAVRLGLEQSAAAATGDMRARLHRRHDDVCEQAARFVDVLGATRVNTWREEVRATKLRGEAGR